MALIPELKEKLWPWQGEILDLLKRKEPYTIVKKYRQSGATEAACWVACLQAYAVENHTVLCVSTKQYASKEQYIDRIKANVLPVLERWKPKFFSQVEKTSSEIRFPNGSVIRAVSNNIEGLRGTTKPSIICDEFASWQKQAQDAFMPALMPMLESKQNEHGFLLIISTPKQKTNNLYADIWTDKTAYPPEEWYRISYDIYDAIEEGIQWTMEEWEKKKEQTPDRDYLAREYEGKFSSNSILYYPDPRPLSFTEKKEPEDRSSIYIGVDVGGVNDPTCALVLEKTEEENYRVLDSLYLWSSDYEFQTNQIGSMVQKYEPIEKIIVDSTAHKSFPDLLRRKVEASVKGKHFTNSWKKQQSEKLLDLMSNKEISFYKDSLVINDSESSRKQTHSWYLQDDIASVEQSMTRSGKTRYESIRGAGRHGDGWAALLCALDASESGFFIAGYV